MKTAFILTRPQMLRALPKHVGFAALFGAMAGFLLYFLDQISLSGNWNLILFFPMAAVYVNAAVLPIIVPGRHWTFGLIGMMMLVFLLIAALVLASMFPFPHSHGNIHPRSRGYETILTKINLVTYIGIVTGALLGLLYGLLSGIAFSMAAGIGFGGCLGYLIGLFSVRVITSFGAAPVTATIDPVTLVDTGWTMDSVPGNDWIYFGPHHFAWQLAVGLALLHLAACAGAALGAPPGPSKK